MVVWFARGLRHGIVTTRYPAHPADPWAADLPTPPAFTAGTLDAELADTLIALCPSGALRRTGAALVYDLGACTACGRCLAAAPHVLRRSGEFELTATVRTQLIKHIPLRSSPAGQGESR